jgi:hypothetical protein
MGYINGSTKLLLCQVLQGKVRIQENKKRTSIVYFLLRYINAVN